MKPLPNSLEFQLPQWLVRASEDHGTFPDPLQKMEFVIRLARRNVEEGTGGPFGAAIFDLASGTLISVGVNLVLYNCWSGAHAEIVAIALAQKRLNSHDLSAPHLPPMQLVTSVEPCAMCLGAIPWSGVISVLSGASDADARSVGFDEGPKVASWADALRERGIDVQEGLLARAARDVLLHYKAIGGVIYNSRRDR